MRRWTLWIVALGIALGIVCGTGEAQAQGPSVYLSPDKTVNTESNFAVMVRINGVEAFDAGQFDLTFDPRLMAVSGVDGGKVGSKDVSVVIWNQVTSGVVRVVVRTGEVDEGVSGSGYLAVVRFNTSSGGGDTSIGLANGFLNAYDCAEITSDWSGVALSITVRQEGGGFDNSKWLMLEVIAVVILLFGLGMLIYWIVDNYEFGFWRGEEEEDEGDDPAPEK